MDTEEHQMYPNAPVALVTVEITFPGEIGAPLPSGVQRAMGDVLGDEWVVEPIQQRGLTLNLGGPSLIQQPTAPPVGAIMRFANRERTAAVALTSGSMSVETTRYGNWPTFRSKLETTIKATERLLRPSGVFRAGLRYIDEVRVRAVEGAEWAKWLSSTVLPPGAAPMIAAGWPPVLWTGASQYDLGEDRALTLRFGPQGAQPGYVVNPDGPLRRLGSRPNGPFFLLDFDASWQPAVAPPWDTDQLLRTCDELRHPVRSLFDHIVSDRLVDEVFKKVED